VAGAAEKNVYCAVAGWNKHVSGPFDLCCHSIEEFVDFFGLDDLSIGERGVLKSPTITVLESICIFESRSVCLMKLGTLTLGTYNLTIVISS
jgi:hypothetical protein